MPRTRERNSHICDGQGRGRMTALAILIVALAALVLEATEA